MRPRDRNRVTAPVAGVVTSLATKRGGSDRVVVYLEGARAFDVAAEVALGADLRQGAYLTTEAVEALLADDAPYRTREQALRLISLRDRTSRELRSRLERAGFDAEMADQTVAWLQGLGYVDDAAYAKRYCEDKLSKGWGERRIASELSRLGVERAVVQEVCAEGGAREGAGERPGLEAVIEVARRRFGGQFRADPRAAERRLAGFLARRGFDWDTIGSVARALEREATETDGESAEEQPFS